MPSDSSSGEPHAATAVELGGRRRLQRAAGHIALIGLVLLLVLGAVPGSLLDAGGTPVVTVRQLTSLGSSWSIFSPEVRDYARWTEVVINPDGPGEERWRVEDERLALLGFQGIRYRKLAEALRRSCRSAAAYAEWAMAEHGASRVHLFNVVDEPRQEVERERTLLLEAQIVDGEAHFTTEGCAT